MRVVFETFGGSWLHFVCPKLCNKCDIKFICYTQRHRKIINKIASYEDVIYLKNIEVFDRLRHSLNVTSWWESNAHGHHKWHDIDTTDPVEIYDLLSSKWDNSDEYDYAG